MKIVLILLTLGLMPMHSCTTSHKMADNQKPSGHYRLYTYPDKTPKKKFDSKRFKRVAFISSNDFKGQVYPEITPINNRFKEQRLLKVGGVANMKAYIDIFRDRYGDEMVYVDAGSFLDIKKNHAQTIFMYKYLGVDVASLGLNEFKIDTPSSLTHIDYLSSLTKDIPFDLVNANLFNLVKAQQVVLPGSKETVIKEFNGLKIGFVGILTRDLAKKIPDKKINGLYIQNPLKNIVSQATKLRRNGANIIVMLANEGLDCTSRQAHSMNLSEDKVNFDPLDSGHCKTYESDFYELLKELPQGTVDLAITSGGNSKVANIVQDLPVVQNRGKGQFLSWVELYYDTKYQTIVPQMTKLFQPVMLCQNFLKNSQDCFKEGSIDNSELIPAKFFGKEIKVQDLPRSIPRLE